MVGDYCPPAQHTLTAPGHLLAPDWPTGLLCDPTLIRVSGELGAALNLDPVVPRIDSVHSVEHKKSQVLYTTITKNDNKYIRCNSPPSCFGFISLSVTTSVSHETAMLYVYQD
jgi:hypothetical protein